MCLNSDLNELRSVLMDRSDIQFLGNAVNKHEPFHTGQVNGRPKLGLMQPRQDTLLEDSQIQK